MFNSFDSRKLGTVTSVLLVPMIICDALVVRAPAPNADEERCLASAPRPIAMELVPDAVAALPRVVAPMAVAFAPEPRAVAAF